MEKSEMKRRDDRNEVFFRNTILREWTRERKVKFANHLLGDKAQEIAANDKAERKYYFSGWWDHFRRTTNLNPYNMSMGDLGWFAQNVWNNALEIGETDQSCTGCRHLDRDVCCVGTDHCTRRANDLYAREE